MTNSYYEGDRHKMFVTITTITASINKLSRWFKLSGVADLRYPKRGQRETDKGA